MAKKKFYRYPLYLLARGVAGFFWFWPRTWLLWVADQLSVVLYYVVTRQRNRALKHLNLAYGQGVSKAEIERMAKGVFRHAALTSAEMLQMSRLKDRSLESVIETDEAFRVYDALLKEGRGIISMTAHLGNWEFLAGMFGLRGYQGAVLARRIYFEPYNRWIVGLRQSMNVATIYRDDSSREILKRLAKNQIIGLLPDQDIDSLKGVFVPFFGRLAYTPVAPVRLSLVAKAPMISNFLVRISRNRYRWVVGEVLRPYQEAEQTDVVEKYTALWMQQFEKVIRQYPDQWGWMHDRWKTQPSTQKNSIKEVMSS